MGDRHERERRLEKRRGTNASCYLGEGQDGRCGERVRAGTGPLDRKGQSTGTYVVNLS